MHRPLLNCALALLASLVLAACGGSPDGQADDAPEFAVIDAAEQGDLQRLAQLLGDSADVNERDQCLWSPLMKAAANGHVETAMALLDAGAWPDLADKGGYTALLLAASNNHAGIVALLLNQGASIDHQELTHGWTALIWAAKRGHLEAVKVLLAHGADPSIRDHAGKNAHDWAVERGETEIARLLDPANGRQSQGAG